MTSPGVINVNLPNQWQPREYQGALWRYMHGGGKRAIAIWHRRSGKDDIAMHYTACAAHERTGVYWHLLPQHNQARKAIWDAVNPHTGKKRIDEAFPAVIRETTREQDMMIKLRCGSTWQVIGSDNYDALVGTTPVGVIFSEWALSSPQAWSLIRPILAENGGWAMFITTPRGRNHAYTMFEMARESEDWFAQILTAEDTGVFDDATLRRELLELQTERGQEDGEAIYLQEYMCSWSASLAGAYYAKVIDQIERAGQIGEVPWNPAAQVHTAWDLGASDQTVIWFFQRNPIGGWNVLECLSNTGKGPDFYALELQRRPYVYGEHLLPHDAEHRNKALPHAATLAQHYRDLGLKNVRVVPVTHSVANDINQVRKTLPLCRFDGAKCKPGIDGLRSYRREWDEKLRCYRDKPLHDWASDFADAFRTFAMGVPREQSEEAEMHDALWADQGRSPIGGY